MTEQFPDDEREDKPRAVSHVFTATLDLHQRVAFADRATDLVRNIVAALEGFIEGRVFEADDGKSVIIMTCWKTRHMWAKAHWHQQVQALLAEYDQLGATFADAMWYGGPVIAHKGLTSGAK
jgi:heme-degrading monooxygenase HmoA